MERGRILNSSKDSYRNPLAKRINDALDVLDQYASDLMSKKESTARKLGRRILDTLIPTRTVYAGLRRLLGNQEMNRKSSLDEKVAILLGEVLKDMAQLGEEYHQEKNSTGENLPTLYEEPILPIELVNPVERSSRVLDKLINATDDPNLIAIFKQVIPEDAEFQSSSDKEQLVNYIEKFKREISVKVNRDVPEYLFLKRGEYWDIRFGGELCHFAHRDGLQYLHTLLAHPNTNISAQVLFNEKRKSAVNRVPTTNILDDAQAKRMKRELKEKLIENENDYEEANSHDDEDQMLRLEDERKSLLKEWNKYFNKYGRVRALNNEVDQARQNVRKAITGTYKKIDEYLPQLSEHFNRCIQTGNTCIYNSNADGNKYWVLE